jgi:hypothetical protein
MSASTFNPVDLVCGIKSYKERNLIWRWQNSGFIVEEIEQENELEPMNCLVYME